MHYHDRLTVQAKLANFKDLQIAIVENEMPLSPVLRSTMAMWDITKTRVYPDTKTALTDIIRDRKPDIVMLNWCGTRNDPLKFARIVRNPAVFPYPFLPMIIVMSNVKRDRVLAARDAGMDEFLAVPFAPKNLYERISSIVHDRRGFVSVPSYFGPDRRRGAMARHLGCERRGESTLIDPEDGRTYVLTDDNRRHYLPTPSKRFVVNA